MTPVAPILAMYIVGAILTAIASRKSLVTFWDGVCLLAWPLMFVARAVIFFIEGNLWSHLDD